MLNWFIIFSLVVNLVFSIVGLAVYFDGWRVSWQRGGHGFYLAPRQ